MTPAGPLSLLLHRDAGKFGSFFSGAINSGQCELGTHLSLWQVRDRWKSASEEDDEVTEREAEARRDRGCKVEPLDPAKSELPNYRSQ